MLPDKQITVGPLFIQEFQRQGSIERQSFSFNMKGLNGLGSTVDVGAPILSNMKNSTAKGAINLGLYNDFFWSTSTQGYALGKTDGT